LTIDQAAHVDLDQKREGLNSELQEEISILDAAPDGLQIDATSAIN
jgi:hypothetical protein